MADEKYELYKPSIGTSFNEQYHLAAYLGAGAFGGVFRAQEKMGGKVIQTVALKAIDPSLMSRDKILAELQTACKLRHPNLLLCTHTVEGTLRTQDRSQLKCCGLVMELADTTLEKHATGALSGDTARTVLQHIAAGLMYMHDLNITHRDLKPANILRVGNTWKIGDFGIARQMSSSSGTITQSISGTPLYMPPEALAAVGKSAMNVAPSWDMWSFGVMAAQLLTGELPFDGLPDILLGKVKPKGRLPAPLAEIVQGCLQPKPAARPTAQQVFEALGTGGGAGRAGTPPKLISQTTGTDYRELDRALRHREWQKADELTRTLMCKVMNTDGYLNEDEICWFPGEDLKLIDNLWVQHSEGKLGFSVQKRIWQECGSPGADYEAHKAAWKRFGQLSGTAGRYVDELDYANPQKYSGHLPSTRFVGRVFAWHRVVSECLFSRAEI